MNDYAFKVIVYDEGLKCYLSFAVQAKTTDEAKDIVRKAYKAEQWGRISKVRVTRIFTYGRKMEQLGIEEIEPTYAGLKQSYEEVVQRLLQAADDEIVTRERDATYEWVKSLPLGESIIEAWVNRPGAEEELA